MYVSIFAYVAVTIKVKSSNTYKQGITRRDLVDKQLKVMKCIDINNANTHH